MKESKFNEAVEKPQHYQDIIIVNKSNSVNFEAIDIIDSVVDHLNFKPSASHAIGNAIKYILRCGKKESDNNSTTDLKNKAKQDLLKAAWYLNKAAERL